VTIPEDNDQERFKHSRMGRMISRTGFRVV
jgi:hypothetical protein